MNLYNRFVQILVLNFAILWANVAVADSGQHQKSATCSNQVYVNAINGTDLKEKPDKNARSVMKLKNRQYLCVVALHHPQADGWIQVKKVPLLNGLGSVCIPDPELSNEDECTDKMADFPSKWLIHKPKGNKCRLLAKLMGSEQQLIVFTKGVCATGWVKDADVQFFAD